MVVINMEIPKGCQHCKFFRKHAFGNGLDYSYSCDLGATDFPMPWIRQMEERAKDCPLIEIKERKQGKWLSAEEYALKIGAEVTEDIKKSLYKFCPFCEQTVFMERNYCPNCGAEMKGEKNNE